LSLCDQRECRDDADVLEDQGLPPGARGLLPSPAVATALNRIRWPFNISGPQYRRVGRATRTARTSNALVAPQRDWAAMARERLEAGLKVRQVGWEFLRCIPVDGRRNDDALTRLVEGQQHLVRKRGGYGIPCALRGTI